MLKKCPKIAIARYMFPHDNNMKEICSITNKRINKTLFGDCDMHKKGFCNLLKGNITEF